MPIEQNPHTGRWWDTDQPDDLRDEYDTQAEAADAKQRREAALALIPIGIWSEIGEYVGRTRPVGVGGRYAQDARDLANMSEVDTIRRVAVQSTRATTRLVDTTALVPPDRQRKAELEAELSEAGVLPEAQAYAIKPGKSPALPVGIERNHPNLKAIYEYRGIEQRRRLKRTEAQQEGFLRQSAELGLDVVALLATGRLANPAMLPEHLTSTAKELTGTSQLGRLAEYLTVEAEVHAGRTVVAGRESPEAWRRFGAAPGQIPTGTKRLGGDRTTFTVRPGAGLAELVTTQQKLVQHRSDVSANITDAVNQLYGRSKPPEVPLLGSVWQVHIILPYPQAELTEVADEVDGHRNKRQRLAGQVDDGDGPEGQLEQERAALAKAIEAAEPRPVDLDAWAQATLADAGDRDDFRFGTGPDSPVRGMVLLIDTPAGRYRGTYPGDGGPPRIDREPAPAYLARLTAIIQDQGDAWAAAVAAERAHQIAKLTRRRRGAVK